MSSIQLGYLVRAHLNMVADLEFLRDNKPHIASRIFVFINEYLEHADIRLNLANNGFKNEVFRAYHWEQMWDAGHKIWILKLQGALPKLEKTVGKPVRTSPYLRYRIAYAFDDTNRIIWLLGGFLRKEEKGDYEPNSDHGQRFINAYKELGTCLSG